MSVWVDKWVAMLAWWTKLCVIVCCIAFVRVDDRKVRSGSLCTVMDSWGQWRTLYLCHYYRCYQTYSTHTQSEQMRQPPAFKWLIASRISFLLWWVTITPVYSLVQGKFSQVQVLMLTDLWNYAILCIKCNPGKKNPTNGLYASWSYLKHWVAKSLGKWGTHQSEEPFNM